MTAPGAPGMPGEPRTAGAWSITVLCGGLGGARVAQALRRLGLDGAATFVTNVGDDLTVDGLTVCPDTDAVLYALEGRFDEGRGWGVRDDRFPPAMEAGPTAGTAGWFNLGEADREHHRRRQVLLDAGRSLSEATADLAGAAGLAARVIPATDAPLRTRVRSADGERAWQEWLVRDGARPVPTEVAYDGLGGARPAPGVLDAIAGAATVLVAPSSPVASVAPILALPGVVDALAARADPAVAVSPVVARRPPVTERDRRRAHARAVLLAAGGFGHDPAEVARWYAQGRPGAVGVFVLDPADAADAVAVEAHGLAVQVAPAPTTTVDGLSALLADRERGPRPAPPRA